MAGRNPVVNQSKVRHSTNSRGPKSSIDMAKLSQLVEQGMTTHEIATFFSVTPGRISQKKRDLVEWQRKQRLSNANSVSEKSIVVLDQLYELNETTKHIHDDLSNYIKKSKLFEKEDIERIKTLLELQKEMRHQWEFNLNYLERLINTESMIIFMDQARKVISDIGGQYPEVADIIVNRIEDITIQARPALPSPREEDE